ncbi:Lipid-A-disaccharide synthase [hydrothermal vent metagenome]|uniref:lipid-A-disaccharide synthase n=1 Tax=hydrothermal vent metagenome TaxID=652676 RepID=A0A1W1BZ99_9ZZZZ
MKILVSALEPSSNLHLKEIMKYKNSIELVGIFDKSLGTPNYDISQMAIMGFVDAIKKIKWFLNLANEMVKLAKDVDKVLLMDSSGFNLPLAKKIKKAYPEKEIIYYILPQVWASRAKRVKKLEKYCDRLLGILPFEKDFYQSKYSYVGHPLLDEIDFDNINREESNSIAYLAGSRKSEITSLMPIYKELQKKLPKHKAILVIPSTFSDSRIIELYGDISDFEISRDTHRTLKESKFAYICSGTATLEAGLIGTPFTLTYIANKIDFFIGSNILKIEQVGLANILLTHYNNTTLHNELLQDSVNVENLLNEYNNMDYKKFKIKSEELRAYLAFGSSKRVSEILMEDIKKC